MSVDVQRVADFLNYCNTLWAAPVQFGLAMYLLWLQVGASALGGIIFMIILLPLNGWISGKIKHIQWRLMRAKDSRTKWMNEILNAIKVLKLYAWELPFIQKILRLRDQECRELYRSAYLNSFLFFAFQAAPLVVSVVDVVDDHQRLNTLPSPGWNHHLLFVCADRRYPRSQQGLRLVVLVQRDS